MGLRVSLQLCTSRGPSHPHSPRAHPPGPNRSWEASGSGSWFAGLLARHDQLHRWLTGGRPRSYWLPGFFNPQGFLTAVKQELARKAKCAARGGWGRAALRSRWPPLCASAPLHPPICATPPQVAPGLGAARLRLHQAG